ncbi:hypothetical protein COY62_02240 [bacterium (Candidatus Howlettbacteria) CG_4_10_14_0_8_um_filter_40_9]|nr:MAG: hypothetical protein COY62_02240 [bacterium (Candidatus Howlettbacteria) CG_4_10_14_0_8_um_filter_40_9]
MEKGDFLTIILRSNKTIFSYKDILLFWGEPDSNATRVRLSYYVKKGQLISVTRGLYAKDKKYDKNELASRIYTPSYVSFETVLGQAGVTFQHYGQIFVASYLSRGKKIDGQSYIFRKIKDIILANSEGVENKEGKAIASKERAFLDILYLNKDYHFDNLSALDWERVFAILPIYENKRMNKKVQSIYKEFKNKI